MKEKGLEKKTTIKQADRYVNGDCADISIKNKFSMSAQETYKGKKEREGEKDR